MGFQLPPFSVVLLATTALVAGSAYVGWQHREMPGTVPFVVFMLFVALWSGTYGVQLLFTSLGAQLFWDNVQYPGGLLTPISFFVFALYYTGREHYLTRTRLVALGAIPVLTSLAVWIPGARALVRVEARMASVGPYAVAHIDHGPLFDVAVIYSYLVVVAGLGLLIYTTFQARELYRKQTALVTLSAVVPVAGSVVTYVLDLTVIDYTPVGMAVFGVVFAVALTRYQLLDVYPVPRNQILQHVDKGIIATDPEGRIIDINPAAAELLRVEGVVGRRLADIDAPQADDIAALADGASTELVVENSEKRFYRCDRSTLASTGGFGDTRVYTFTDITDRRRRQHELEAKNERLDSFAEVLSHDLRNPLSVASGATELAERDPESDHFEKVHTAHDRMGEIIDDMLMLARSGQSVADPEVVDIGTVAERAWSLVQTHDASLTVADTGDVRADPQRLQQLFENLFRNAVEHGGNSVAVRVGTAEWGFYVADDGPGIPPEKRESVFTSGVSMDTDGAGVGLAVVSAVVEGHDWSVSVTDSEDGGARFEIRT